MIIEILISHLVLQQYQLKMQVPPGTFCSQVALTAILDCMQSQGRHDDAALFFIATCSKYLRAISVPSLGLVGSAVLN